MAYTVKEIYYTLQGEGAQTGRPAVFCRFEGCNLWSGREEDRKSAICRFCDTEFLGIDGPGGGSFATADTLAEAVARCWETIAQSDDRRFAVCTGGEPLLQLDEDAVQAMHRLGFEVAIETNGTRKPPEGVDWVCVSPKAGAKLRLRRGDELKLVYPQKGAPPELFEDLDFRRFLLQPMDGANRDENVRFAVDYCLRHPKWELSLQTHKWIGLP